MELATSQNAVRAAVKQIDSKHETPEQEPGQTGLAFARLCVVLTVCDGAIRYNQTHCAQWVGLAEFQLLAWEHL